MAMTQEKPDQPKTYRGSCHCGNYVFEARLPEIRSAEHCNCNFCHKKGALWVHPDRASFKFLEGAEETLTHYTFGKKLLDHKARRPLAPPRRWLPVADPACTSSAATAAHRFSAGASRRHCSREMSPCSA